MNEILTTENLKNAGLALALLYSIYTSYKLSRDFSRTINNHVSHFTEVNQKLNDSIDRLINFLDKKRRL